MSLVISFGGERYYLQPDTVEYDVHIHNGLALSTLKQIFKHDMKSKGVGSYLFPLDYKSTICSLLVRTPREDIEGKIYENIENSEQDDNLINKYIYNLQIGEILPGDIFIVTYTYISETAFSSGGYAFYVPVFISQKYRNMNMIPSPNHNITINIKIENFIAFIKNIDSRFKIDYHENCILCKLETFLPLSCKIPILYTYKTENKIYKFEIDNYTMVMGNFKTQLSGNKNTDEIVFTVDCSNLLCKRKIYQLKSGIVNCLRKMPQNLKFNIILLGDKIKVFSDQLVISSPNNIKKAIIFCNSIKEYAGLFNFKDILRISLKASKSSIIIINSGVLVTKKANKLSKKFDHLSILNTCIDNNYQIFNKLVRNKGLSLFSPLDESIPENLEKILFSYSKGTINNPIFNLSLPQNWISYSSIVSEQPFNVYAILNQHRGMDLFEVNGTDILSRISFLPSKFPFTMYQLGCIIAKKIIQDSQKIDPMKLSMIEVDFNIVTKYTSYVMTNEKVVLEIDNKKMIKSMILNRISKKMHQEIISISKQKPDDRKEIDCEIILHNYIDTDKYLIDKDIVNIIHMIPKIVLNSELFLGFYILCYIAVFGTFKQFRILCHTTGYDRLKKFKRIIKSIKKNCNCNLGIFDIILEWCEQEIKN